MKSFVNYYFIVLSTLSVFILAVNAAAVNRLDDSTEALDSRRSRQLLSFTSSDAIDRKSQVSQSPSKYIPNTSESRAGAINGPKELLRTIDDSLNWQNAGQNPQEFDHPFQPMQLKQYQQILSSLEQNKKAADHERLLKARDKGYSPTVTDNRRSSVHSSLSHPSNLLVPIPDALKNRAVPPPGLPQPYGHRTVIMLRYPDVFYKPKHHNHHHRHGLPISNKPFKAITTKIERVSPSDFGVVLAQNYVHRPYNDYVSKHAALAAQNEDGSQSPMGRPHLYYLARLLSEQKRPNPYSELKAMKHNKKPEATKAPFVLAHLETFSRKSDDADFFNHGEKVFSNGTIIYPSEHNANILASAHFQFENSDEVEFVFERPLQHNEFGIKKPIRPKSEQRIRKFLKFLHDVHRKVHLDGTRNAAEDRIRSSALNRAAFPDSRPLRPQEVPGSSIDWLHTTSMGIRTLTQPNEYTKLTAYDS